MNIDQLEKDILSSYEETELLPMRGEFGGTLIGAACGVGAPYARAALLGKTTDIRPGIWFAEHYGVSISWVDGFICGFDESDPEAPEPNIFCKDWLEGYASGRRVAKKVFEEVKP